MGKKGAIELDMFGYLIIAIIVLIIALGGYLILSGKGLGMLSQIKNLFRFGG